jgi:hypothetical protein
MTTNYERYRQTLATASIRPGAVRMAAVMACASAFAMCGCGESSATVTAIRQAGAEVRFVPVLTGGVAGWCITGAAGAGCPISRLMRGPIVAEFWIAEGARNRAEGFAVTTSEAAAVSVAGSRSITTRREPTLPLGLRAVAVKIQGAWAPEVETPSLFGRPPHRAPEGLPRFTSLDRAGKPLVQNREEGPFVTHEVAGRSWSRPAAEPAGACGLRSVPLRGLVANAGFVVTHATPSNGLLGRPFLSCVSTSYSLKGWPLVGSVLVDANRPGARPGLLPGMHPVVGYPRMFDALGSNGPMVARRVSGGWLVVSGGEGEAQRRTLLEHLHSTVHQ